jgi:hypothetical protein
VQEKNLNSLGINDCFAYSVLQNIL